MKKLSLAVMGLAVAGLMTMVSCRKPVNQFNTTGEKITFSASIDNGSKTTIFEDEILWSENDAISINGELYELSSEYGKTSGDFVGDLVNPVGGKYFASYPYSNAEGYVNNGSCVKFNIPEAQMNYADLSGKIPMVAYTTDKSGNLSFMSMVNVLEFSLVGAHSLTDIVVSSTEKLSGDFTVEVSDNSENPGIPDLADGGNKRTIHFDDPLILDNEEAQKVYFILPVFESESSKISVKFTGDDGEMTVGPMALSGSTTPNHRYYSKDNLTVTLTPRPKTVNFIKPNLNWSVCNFGATNGETPESWYGDYYAWGATETYYEPGTAFDPNPTWKDKYTGGYSGENCPYIITFDILWGCTFKRYNGEDGNTVLLPEDDAITAALGPGWRMPTWEEWAQLFENNTYKWLEEGEEYSGIKAVVAGLLVLKGKGEKMDKTVYMFLPAAGYFDDTSLTGAGTHLRCWSSSLETYWFGDDHRCAMCITADWGHQLIGLDEFYQYHCRSYGCSVRPVRDVE